MVLALLLSACGGSPGPIATSSPTSPGASPTVPGLPRGTLVVETASEPVEIDVEIAETREARTQGLMFRESLDDGDGMVFLHEEPAAGGFWMKNTLIPLTVAAWGEDGVIHTIVDMEPCEADPCPTYPFNAEWVGAVEVNQGYLEDQGVEIGARVELRR